VKRPERIGVFGGTFDPIHNGHLKAAAAVGRRFGLDRILFVPSNIPPHKARAGMAPARDRMAMVELAVRGRSRFVASALEIKTGGRSYSIRTLRRIRRLHPRARIFFIVGADAFLEIKIWREWRSVLDESRFIVMTRPGVSLAAARRAPGAAYADRIRAVGRIERVREDWFSAFRIFLLPIDALPISATQIRRRVLEGRAIAGLVPAAVARYIREHKLYL
jgi:nicotinate-nucleotide adenylyltransferase